MADPFEFLADDEPTAQEQARALAEALRGQRGIAQAFMLDPLMSKVGAGMLNNVQDQEQAAARASDTKLMRVLQAKRDASEDRYRQSQEVHQRTGEDLQRQALEQGRFTLANVPGVGGFRVNGRTGAIEQVTDAPNSDTGGLKPKDIEAAFSDLAKHVSRTEGRSRLAPEYQKRLDASERLKAIAVGEDGQLRNLTPQQLTELAAASGALITNGSPTEHTIQSMLPRGMGVGSAQFLEWLQNDPQGANQQAYVKMMLDQAEREEKTIRPQLRRAQLEGVPNHAKLRAVDAKRFESILTAAGLDPLTARRKRAAEGACCWRHKAGRWLQAEQRRDETKAGLRRRHRRSGRGAG
jgi:hypothetical protein